MISMVHTTEDREALKKVKESISHNSATSRYKIAIPWKENLPKLPDNKNNSLSRLGSTERKLKKGEIVSRVYQHTIDRIWRRATCGKSDKTKRSVSFNQTDMVCITETWLSPAIPDNLVSLSNFNLFRNDRLVSNGGGVCAYINSNIYCRRIEEFENSSIESLWLSMRPKKLPRSVSVILLAVVYHSTN
jgi:hypothetical protein